VSPGQTPMRRTPGRKGRIYSIRQKLTWMNMLVSGAALLLACTAFASYELSDFRQTLVRSLSIQAQIAGLNSASALLFNDPESARNTLSALQAGPHIRAAESILPRATALRPGRAIPAPVRCPRIRTRSVATKPFASRTIF
jgi:hypothetical protein